MYDCCVCGLGFVSEAGPRNAIVRRRLNRFRDYVTLTNKKLLLYLYLYNNEMLYNSSVIIYKTVIIYNSRRIHMLSEIYNCFITDIVDFLHEKVMWVA